MGFSIPGKIALQNGIRDRFLEGKMEKEKKNLKVIFILTLLFFLAPTAWALRPGGPSFGVPALSAD